MIIQIDRLQPELRLFVNFPPGEEAEAAKLRLHIRPPEDVHFTQLSPWRRKGDWAYPADEYPPDHHRHPVLIYPALSVTPEGEAVFRLDHRFWKRPCGRWFGEVWFGRFLIAAMDIDYRPHRHVMTGARTVGRGDA